MAKFAENRRARFDYEILEEFEAGIVLVGHEVKAVRAGRLSLDGSYALIRDGRARLHKVRIDPYQMANTPESYVPDRPRDLLLSKKEIREIERKSEQPGVTVIPLAFYANHGLIKVEMALVKGKRTADKRQSIKKREADIEMRRAMK